MVCGIFFPLEVAKLASINFVKYVCTGILGKLLEDMHALDANK